MACVNSTSTSISSIEPSGLAPQDEAKEIQTTPHCAVREYPVPSDTISFCTAKITGRYPEKGRAANSACEQFYFVLSGSGIIHSERGNFPIKQGDLYFFRKNELYWVEGKELFVAVGNAPAWNPQQYIHKDS